MVPHGPGELGARRHLVVSQRLRQRRRELGLTQRDVTARLAALGVRSTNKSLSSLEHGSGLDVGKLPELASALDCSVTWLLGLTDEPGSWEPTHPLRAASVEPAVAPLDPVAPPVDGDGDLSREGAGPHRPWILGPLDAGLLADRRPGTTTRTR